MLKFQQKLISGLKEFQGEQSDAAFARRLGVHRNTWLDAQKGRNLAGLELLAGAVRAYPDSSGLVLGYLRDYPGRAALALVQPEEEEEGPEEQELAS